MVTVIHVLWPILAIEFDGYVSLASEAVFRSFQRRSGQGQVKKGQIFKFINVDKKGIYLDQFWLTESNGVICFCVRPPPSFKNCI